MIQYMETKHVIDACAAGISFACVAQILPPIAASLSIIWLSIQLWEYFSKKFKK